jgi:hypothetical protein
VIVFLIVYSIQLTERSAPFSKLARAEASDELEIGILPRSTIKMTFRHFTAPGAPFARSPGATTTAARSLKDFAERILRIRSSQSYIYCPCEPLSKTHDLSRSRHLSQTLPNGQFNGGSPLSAYVGR